MESPDPAAAGVRLPTDGYLYWDLIVPQVAGLFGVGQSISIWMSWITPQEP